MKTPNLILENVEKIEKLFPNCIKETKDEDGNIVKKVDFDLLRAELGDKTTVEGLDERYRLDWPGKKKSILKANTPITQTLRPEREMSVDWDNTQNIYIEGDNFEVLKILQEAYLGKVKLIYIDPPYNTGRDFVYNDNFDESTGEYRNKTERTQDGLIMVKNTETVGRFHSDWLSMMYERLKVARDLLTDDGIMMISIDENEFLNLGKLCNDIFGESNFVECLVYDKKAAAKGVPPVNMVAGVHEYIFCYAKNFDKFSFIGIPRSTKDFSNPDNDPRGIRRNTNIKSTTSEKRYKIKDPVTGNEFEDTWAFSEQELNKMIQENRILFPKDKNGQVRAKEFYSEFNNSNTPIKSSLGLYDAQWNTEMLVKMMGGKFFQNPKHLKLMDDLVRYTTSKDDIIMDFFSGAGTTAHAVMDINANDGGSRKFIMVQLPELTEENSDAYKAGYKNICEIGKERIRRAGKKIKEETGADIDYGFRVYKVDESCMKDVYYHPNETKQENLGLFTSNIKDDRTAEDLLTQVILNLGLTLDLPIEEKRIGNNKVFYVAGNSLVACFDDNVDFSIIEEIAKDKPLKMVLRDSSFRSDADMENFENTMKELSRDTVIKVI